MKLKVYGIYDRAAEAFATPFFMHNDGLALRGFQDLVNSVEGDNQIAAHPEQFTLYCIAEFEDQTGKIEPLETVLNIANGEMLKVNREVTKVEQNELYALLQQIRDDVNLIMKGDKHETE